MRRLIACCVVGAVLGLPPVEPAHADIIETDMTAGGTILAMPAAKEAQPHASLGALLQTIHQRLGAKPLLGKIETDTSGSVVVAHFDGEAKRARYEGLATVNVSAGKAVALYDTSNRFGKSETAMLQYLQSLHAAGDPVPPMKQRDFSDNSGSVALPDGWKIVQASQGSAAISGPNGERVVLGLFIPAYDPTVPGSKTFIDQVNASKTPALTLIAPYDGDITKAFLGVNSMLAQEQKIEPPKINIISKQPNKFAGHDGEILRGTVEGGAMPGARSFVTNVQLIAPSKETGLWGLVVSQSQIPVALAAKEQATANAIFASFRLRDKFGDYHSTPAIESMDDVIRGVDPTLEQPNKGFAPQGITASIGISWSDLQAASAKLHRAPADFMKGVEY